MFVCAIIKYFSPELTSLVDLPSKLSTHDFKLSFQQIQAVFITFKITFRSLVCFFQLSCTLLNEYTSFHTLVKHRLTWF